MKHYARIISYLLNKDKNILIIGSPNSGKSTVLATVMEQREKYLSNHLI
jgi:GTPase Era involved in 16S rRNA processing